MGNYSDIPGGLRLPHQAFLDAKTFCLDEATLKNLGTQSNLAYTYGEGLKVYCQAEKTIWEWREVKANETGLLASHFTYPSGWTGNSKTYSELSFNFFEILPQDNIKKEIYLKYTIAKIGSFADSINSLPNFNITAQEIVTFKSVSKIIGTTTTYYIEILGIGKGNFGIGGTQLTLSDLKVTSSVSTLQDIIGIPTTQVIDLGYSGSNVVTALNIRQPNIVIQGQNEGYVFIKGIFEGGIYHEYLWLGTGGIYGGGGGLQSTFADFKEIDGIGAPIDTASTIYSGTVKTDTTEEDPIVYTKATIDKLLNLRDGYTPFKFIQKGFGNIDLENNEVGDIFSGWTNNGTIRYTEAKWLGGVLTNSDNFIPLVQTEI